MSSKCCFLYVLRLKPGCYYYIGTTTRTFKERLQEHLDGYGSKWSTKHGVHSVVSVTEIPIAGASQVEDETTIEYMRRYGCQNVRGGKYVRVIDDDATWWLPVEFQPGQINAYGLYPASRCTAVAETPSVPSPAGAPLLCPDPLV
jgi:predicted GIY-YIG superfamily endonuclease